MKITGSSILAFGDIMNRESNAIFKPPEKEEASYVASDDPA